MKTITRLSIIFFFSICILFSCKKTSINSTKTLSTGPDKEFVEVLRQQATKRNSINRTPEQKEAISIQQEENNRVEEMRQDAIEQMRADGSESAKYYDDELENEEKTKTSYKLGFLFPVLIVGGFLFLIWWFGIRNFRNKFRDLSYSKGEVIDKIDDAMHDLHFDKMSDEQRESLEKMKLFLNGEK